MGDSTLSLTYSDLMTEIGVFLYGKEYAELDLQQFARCDEIVNAGYRQFLYPPMCEGVPAGYQWNFLQPTVTITTEADVEDQDLPYDFGTLMGTGFTFAPNMQVAPVLADVGEARIRHYRQSSDSTGYPQFAAIRMKAGTGVEGQRREVMWYPTPNAAYVLSYRYETATDALGGDNQYPLGALHHAETLRHSCLAAAEATRNDEIGIHYHNFCRSLASSVMRDKRDGPKFYGSVGTHGQYGGGSSYQTARSGYALTVRGDVIQQ